MATPASQQNPRAPKGEGFQLKRFPKEFEKDRLHGFDPFLVIANVITAVILIGFFSFMASNADRIYALTEEEVRLRQERLIQKIYKIDVVEEEIVPEEKKEEEVKPEEEKSKEEERKEEIKQRIEQKSANKQPSAAEKIAQRREAAAQRRSARESSRNELASSAQLALITGGAASEGEAVADVLGDAKGNVNLDDALKGTSGISLAKNSSSTTRIVKGGREGGHTDINDLVSGVGEVKTTALGSRRSAIDFGELSIDENESKTAGRSSESINGKMKEIAPGIENCYKSEKRLNPGLAGVIAVAFEINARGQVKKVNITQDTVNNSKVTECIKNKFRTLRFEPASKDITVKTKYVLQ